MKYLKLTFFIKVCSDILKIQIASVTKCNIQSLGFLIWRITTTTNSI